MILKQRQQLGLSLVEAILAIAIFAILVSGLAGSLVYGQFNTSLAGARDRATFVAEEGLEAVRSIRDDNFSNLSDGTHGLTVSENQWTFSGSSDTTDVFTRAIIISSVDTYTKNITSTVTWDQTNERSGSISLTTYLTDWQRTVISNTCQTHCQSLGYSDGICRPNQKQCSVNSETYEAEGDTYCTGGPSADTCCCVP